MPAPRRHEPAVGAGEFSGQPVVEGALGNDRAQCVIGGGKALKLEVGPPVESREDAVAL